MQFDVTHFSHYGVRPAETFPLKRNRVLRLWVIKWIALGMEADAPPTHRLRWSALADPDLTPKAESIVCLGIVQIIACTLPVPCFQTTVSHDQFAVLIYHQQHVQEHRTQNVCYCLLLHLHQSLPTRLKCPAHGSVLLRAMVF